MGRAGSYLSKRRKGAVQAAAPCTTPDDVKLLAADEAT
jgi:hypothetical protein